MTPQRPWVRAIRSAIAFVCLSCPISPSFADWPSPIQRQLGPENPFMAPDGVGAMHSDAYASDVSPLAGPGIGPVSIISSPVFRPCATTLMDRNGLIVAFCFGTGAGGNLILYDPETLVPLATMATPPAGQFGVYQYLDEQDRAVIGTGNGHIWRVAHQQNSGVWSFTLEDDWDLSAQIPGLCPRPAADPACDYIESVTPDWDGNIWFSTSKGLMGALDPGTGAAQTTRIPSGETVGNSIASSPDGVALVSTHALYLFEADRSGAPRMLWRQPYDRGTSVKPGQLTQGSGTTPTFLGADGDKYLAIVDNADEQEHLLVYHAKRQNAELVCSLPIFSPGASATEISPIGIGRTVIVTNTYGYLFGNPALHTPAGGLQRIDIHGHGCEVVWSNPLTVGSVAKMSVQDGQVYAVARQIEGSAFRYDWTVIDAQTGATETQQFIGAGFLNDPLGFAGNISRTGDYYQGVIKGIIRFHAP